MSRHSKQESDSEIKDLQRKVVFLEAENSRLTQEVDQNKAQLTQYKTTCESQQQAMKDKDELLQQLRELNESLQNDIKTLREVQKAAPKHSGSSFSGSKNPWTDGSSGECELEQYRKLFVGGLNYDTTEESLKAFYEKYGEVLSSVIMSDNQGRSRGFGFVVYTKAEMVDEAQKARPHVIDGRTVDAKRALAKEDTDKPENSVRTQKLFVGGMRKDTEEGDLKEYFGRFGTVEKVEMMVYKDTGRKRGFAFVFFDDYDPVDKMIMIKHHVICGQRCEVKKAVPRDREDNKRSFNKSNQNSQGSGGYYDNMGGGGGNDYNYNNGGSRQGRGNQNRQQQYQMGGSQMGGLGNSQMGMGGQMGGQQMGSLMGGMSGQQMGSGGTMGFGSQMGNNHGYGTNQQQQQQQQGQQGQQSGSGDLPPEAQALWSSYMSFMQSQQQQGSTGPIRNQNTHANRSTGPYNTNMPHNNQQPPAPQQQQQQQSNFGAYNTTSTSTTS